MIRQKFQNYKECQLPNSRGNFLGVSCYFVSYNKIPYHFPFLTFLQNTYHCFKICLFISLLLASPALP